MLGDAKDIYAVEAQMYLRELLERVGLPDPAVAYLEAHPEERDLPRLVEACFVAPEALAALRGRTSRRDAACGSWAGSRP